MSNYPGDRDDRDSVMSYTCACGKYGSEKPAPAVSSDDELHTITSCPPPVLCAWYALCTREAVGTAPHPILIAVPICAECAAKHDLHVELF